MKKPIILINGGPALDPAFESDSWVFNKTYVYAVRAGDGAPVLCAGRSSAADYAEICDGLILTGSFSYAPRPALQERLAPGGRRSHEREVFDRELFEAFRDRGRPILGICLGQQIINLFLGGTLKCNFKFNEGVEHMFTAHNVKTEPGSLLHELFGGEFRVNSRHNNAIETLAPGLKATAWSPDGIIEAVEHTELPIWAFQFHPERTRGDLPEPPDGPDSTPLFRWFVGQCRR